MLALAESLLKRFGVPQGNESLMGDLVEDYRFRQIPCMVVSPDCKRHCVDGSPRHQKSQTVSCAGSCYGLVLLLVWQEILHLAEPRPSVWHRGPIYYWEVLLLSTMTLSPGVCRVGGWSDTPRSTGRHGIAVCGIDGGLGYLVFQRALR